MYIKHIYDVIQIALIRKKKLYNLETFENLKKTNRIKFQN